MIFLLRLPDKILLFFGSVDITSCLLASFCIDYKKVFELVLTGDNRKNTNNTVIQRKYKRYGIFVKNADKKLNYNFFRYFYIFELYKVLNICAKCQMFVIILSEIK